MSFVVPGTRIDRKSSPLKADPEPFVEEVVPSSYFRWKSGLSRLGAYVVLIPALPVLGLLIIIVRLTSSGPTIYRQVRVGYGGHPFHLLKIRTMRADAEEKTGPVWTEPNDPRITRLGRILRKVHLDELPQLFNVLRGEMTLIGPRPERPEFTQYLAQEVPGYMKRYSVPPGITGLAQINLPPDTDVASVKRKLVLDLDYIRHASVLMDVRILVCTSLRLIGIPGTFVARLLGLTRAVEISDPVDCEDRLAEEAPSTYRVKLNGNRVLGNGNGKMSTPQEGKLPTT